MQRISIQTHMKIVLLARMLSFGGAERQLVALAKGLHERGINVQVVLFYEGGGFDAEVIAMGIPVIYLGKKSRWDLIGFLIRFCRTLSGLQPEVVYSFLDLPNILAAIFHQVLGRPRLIWSVRAAGVEMQHYDWLTRFIPWIEAHLSFRAHRIIANSQAGLVWARDRGFVMRHITVVENGIDTGRFRADPAARDHVRREWQVSDDETLIGLPGRLDTMKDHPNFLRACARLASKCQGLRFVCIGSGAAEYQEELAALAKELGIESSLIWAGPRQDMPAVYGALDLACSASAFGEGFSNVVSEAMACGVPCVVTDVGDSARIVGDCGEVVPARDPFQLSLAMEKMLDRLVCEPDLRQRARARIENLFSVDNMVERTKRVLCESN